MRTRINVLGRAPHIVTDFGMGWVLDGEDERGAALRIYRSWCQDNGSGQSIAPDPDPLIVLHDAK